MALACPGARETRPTSNVNASGKTARTRRARPVDQRIAVAAAVIVLRHRAPVGAQ